MNKTIRSERALRLLTCAAVLAVLCLTPAFADNEYVHNGAQWILDGLYWIALVIIVWGVVKLLIARNFIGMGILVVLGGICVALIVSPESMKTMGQKLLEVIGLS